MFTARMGGWSVAVLAAGLWLGAGGYTAIAQVDPAGVLAVTPPDDFKVSGLASEIWSNKTKTYTLTNTGTAALDWTISWGYSTAYYWEFSTPAGALQKDQGGTLAPGESVEVTVEIIRLPVRGLNDPGYARDTLTFTNATNGLGTTSRSLSITHKAGAQTGFHGPSQATLTWVKGDTASRVYGPEWGWENSGDYYLSSGASVNQPWLTLRKYISHPCCGCGGANVKGNTLANDLPVGSHAATVSFTFGGYGLDPADKYESAAVTLKVVWPGDINADFAVDVADLLWMVASWEKTSGQTGYNRRCDINLDQVVDMADLLLFLEHWGEGLE